MRDFTGKVALVTGAASGIGRALAERFAAERMKVVLADVEVESLETVAAGMRGRGAQVLAVPADVTSGPEVEALAKRAVGAFGAVHVVCNNAGVSLGGPVWEHTVADWRWILGVNLWGVIHGVRVFVPLMLRQGGEGHVVNTASVAGLTTNPFMGAYNVTKHAVVALSETLLKDLALAGSSVKVSVLCPGFVNTRIADADRNRPLARRYTGGRPRPEAMEQLVRSLVAGGLAPAILADRVLEAIREERFWILTHPELRPRIAERCREITEERNPRSELRFA
jgi:NAD(P)-dependent dehydrogenase (short-subunit alcohol dehydrogenase family)